MSAEIIVAAATEKDINKIAEIEISCFSEPWSAQTIASCMRDTSYIFFAAHCGGELVGYGSMRYILDEAEICNIAVAEKFRRYGAASGILSEIINAADELRLNKIHLEVRASNIPAVLLYKKHGFMQSGLRRNFYDKPREDALLMTKEIGMVEI